MTGVTAVPETMRVQLIAALPRLRRFCQALTGSAEDGDDLMQATVERALTRAELFEPGTRLDSWLFRIAQNLRIDAARAAQRRGPTVDVDELVNLPGDDGRRTVEERSDLQAAHRALRALPEDQRATFVLVVIEGLSYREAAAVLEVPVGTVMSRLARARSRIEQVVSHTPGESA